MAKYYLEYYLKKYYLQAMLACGRIRPDRYKSRLEAYRKIFIRVPLPAIKPVQNHNQGIRVPCPDDADFAKLSPVQHKAPKVDVLFVIDEHDDAMLHCLHALLSAKHDVEYELTVLDDHLADAKLSARLSEFSAKLGFTYLRNTEKKGLVTTLNAGMSLHDDRDVLVLDGNTEAFDGFIDLLHEVAYTDGKCACVSPLCNAACVSNYPLTMQDFTAELSADDRKVDTVAAEVNGGMTIEAPCGNRFCIYIRRAALNTVGLADPLFNESYGWENDLCLRFMKAGFSNLIVPSVFARHYGAVTNGEDKLGVLHEYQPLLLKKYPNYLHMAQVYAAQDPLKPARIALDAGFWLKTNRFSHSVLHIVHANGGGTQTFVDDLSARLNVHGIGSLVMNGTSAKTLKASLDTDLYPNLASVDYYRGPEELTALIKAAKVSHIHIHSLASCDHSIVCCLKQLKETLGVRITVTIHDYEWICSRANLMPDLTSYCTDPVNFNWENIDRQSGASSFLNRLGAKELFGFADRITVPDADVAQRMSICFPKTEFTVVPHSETRNVITTDNASGKYGKLTIALLGLISHSKGLAVAEGLTRYIIEHGFNAECIIIGGTYPKHDNITRSIGPYHQDTLKDFIAQERPTVWFQASIWPETYSYTLSEMLATDIPVASFDIGAQASRLRNLGLEDNLIPYDLRFNQKELFERLKSIAEQRHTVAYVQHETPLEDYYQQD